MKKKQNGKRTNYRTRLGKAISAANTIGSAWKSYNKFKAGKKTQVRLKRKGSESYTKTETKRRKESVSQAIHSSEKFLEMNVVLHKDKHKKAGKQIAIAHDVRSYLIQSAAGEQSWTVMDTVGGIGNYIVSSGVGAGAGQSVKRWYDLNLNANTTAGGVYPVIVPSNEAIHWNGTVLQWWITNFTSSACTLEIFAVVPKQSLLLAQDPVQVLGRQYGTEDGSIGAMTFPTAGNAVAGTSGADILQNPGMTIANARDFSRLWKVVNRRVIKLAGSESINVRSVVTANITADKNVISDLRNAGNGIEFQKGKVASYMIRLIGNCIRDNTPAGAFKPTLAGCALGVVVSQKHSLSSFPLKAKSANTVYGNSSVSANVTSLNEQMINMVDFVGPQVVC